MPHINHRRGDTRRNAQQYPWDNRSRKVPNFRYFRNLEKQALLEVRRGVDPDCVLFPHKVCENDNAWNYD